MNTNNTNSLNFSNDKIFIGIDVHKKNWMITLYSSEFELKTFSQPPDPGILKKYLTRNYPFATYKALYEAGFSGFWIQRELQNHGIDCKVIHPADVPTSDKEKRQKTDRIDSRKLAKECKNGQIEGIYIPNINQQEDRDLLRVRHRIVIDKTRVKNRIKFYLMFHGTELSGFKGRQWSKKYLSHLKEIKLTTLSGTLTLQTHIEELENLQVQEDKINVKIKELSQSLGYKKQCELLRSIPSIGIITAMTFLTEIGDISRFKSLDALCSFFGLVPNTHSSGENERVGYNTKRGNLFLKSMLIECAWIAVRNDPALLQCFKKLILRMNANKAIIRIAKRLLSRIRHVLLTKEKYIQGIV
jgi:transposase